MSATEICPTETLRVWGLLEGKQLGKDALEGMASLTVPTGGGAQPESLTLKTR